MAHIPYRTGIPSILAILTKLCKLLTIFRPIVIKFLTEDQIEFWDALMAACEAFIFNVPNPRPGDPE